MKLEPYRSKFHPIIWHFNPDFTTFQRVKLPCDALIGSQYFYFFTFSFFTGFEITILYFSTDNDVTGYPTLKFFKKGSDETEKYRGARDLAALSKYVAKQLGQEPEEVIPFSVFETHFSGWKKTRAQELFLAAFSSVKKESCNSFHGSLAVFHSGTYIGYNTSYRSLSSVPFLI